MLSKERKATLREDLAYQIDRYLDKQWVLSETIDYVSEDGEEKQYLNSLATYYAVVDNSL